MRLLRRRRLAGLERVPTEVHTPELLLTPLGLVVLRIGPGRGLLDYPGQQTCNSVANVWPLDGGWREALWPLDARYRWFIAPTDLRPGHILEFNGALGRVVGSVVAADDDSVTLLICADRDSARARAGEIAKRTTQAIVQQWIPQWGLPRALRHLTWLARG